MFTAAQLETLKRKEPISIRISAQGRMIMCGYVGFNTKPTILIYGRGLPEDGIEIECPLQYVNVLARQLLFTNFDAS